MPPLPVLLSHVLLDIKRDVEAGPEQLSLLVFANLLRVIPEEGIDVTELPAAARISRRALKAWLGLERQGWLEVESTAPRVKVVRLTDVGVRAREEWAQRIASTERSWSERVRGSAAARTALEALVSRVDLELPHYPMTYGTADVSAIGGKAVPAKAGPPRIPAHGTDWVPVIRESASGVSDLPLHSLLSQALMAFTVDFEETTGFPMAMADILRRAMPTTSVRMATLPSILGVNGSGKSLLERHGVVRVTGKGDERLASLTNVGMWIRDAYEPGIARVTTAWREAYGEDVVDALEAGLAVVDNQLPDDLPDHVLIRHRPGVLFSDVSFGATE